MRNFKDERFIGQYLSPRLIREFRLFAIADHAAKSTSSTSTASTTTRGYRACASCSRSSTRSEVREPDIQVVRFNRAATAR